MMCNRVSRWPRKCTKCHGLGYRRRRCDECSVWKLKRGHYCPACQSEGWIPEECDDCAGYGVIRPDIVLPVY